MIAAIDIYIDIYIYIYIYIYIHIVTNRLSRQLLDCVRFSDRRCVEHVHETGLMRITV